MRALLRYLILFGSVATLGGCGKNGSTYVESNAERCQKAKVANQFIVHWKKSPATLVDQNKLNQILKTHTDEIKLVEPNYNLISDNRILRPQEFAETPQVTRAAQYFHDIIHSEAAWNLGFYGQGINVAVVDTGVLIDHPILRSHLSINELELRNGENNIDDDGNGFVDDVFGWNFVDNHATMNDETGHGTAIAGIITGGDNNPSLGVAPKSQIIPIDFMNETGGTEFHAQQALSYALSRHAQIINNSWSTNCSELLKNSFVSWSHENVIFVNASGNMPVDVSENEITPSSFSSPNIINVGSSDDAGDRSSFSGYGRTVTLFAPGEFIPVIFPTSGWDQAKATSGTSFSAAIVSGAAALLWSAFPQATGPEIISLLHEGANQEPTITKVLDIKRSMEIGNQRFHH